MKRTNVLREYLKLNEDTALNKVMQVLFKYPEKEFSLTDLAKEAEVAKANIGKILETLYRSEIITIEKLSKIWRIRANQTNWQYLRNKIINNLSNVYNGKLIDILIEHFHNPKAIILFGSYRKGDDISSSDIDIAIESDEAKGYEIIELKELSGIEKNLGKKIQLHVFSRAEADINVFNNIANGIVLWGFLEVKK